jgi:hypothetical protein
MRRSYSSGLRAPISAIKHGGCTISWFRLRHDKSILEDRGTEVMTVIGQLPLSLLVSVYYSLLYGRIVTPMDLVVVDKEAGSWPTELDAPPKCCSIPVARCEESVGKFEQL